MSKASPIPHFSGAYLRASAVLDQLSGLSREISHIPLVAPVTGAAIRPLQRFRRPH